MLSVFYDIDLIYTYTGQDSKAGLDKLCKKYICVSDICVRNGIKGNFGTFYF